MVGEIIRIVVGMTRIDERTERIIGGMEWMKKDKYRL